MILTMWAHFHLMLFLVLHLFNAYYFKVPPQGKCLHLKFGGKSHVHYYICCNNCHPNEPAEYCNKHTYQTASTIDYCGDCGLDKGGGVGGEKFKCGGCDGQTAVEEKCKEKWKHFSFPVTCWIFAGCMVNKCKKKHEGNKWKRCANESSAQLAFASSDENSTEIDSDSSESWWCGDGKCDPEETIDDCPMDCCQLTNNNCTFSNGTCPLECCNEATCCRSGPSNFGGFYQVDGCASKTANINNPYTKEQNCPLSYEPYVVAYFLSPESKCGTQIVLCLGEQDDPQKLFGGYYQVCDGACHPKGSHQNPATQNYTCPNGFDANLAGRVANDPYFGQGGSNLYICLAPGVEGIIGGFYQMNDQGPGFGMKNHYKNGKTLAFSCPYTYKPYQYGRVLAAEDRIGSSLFVCLNNVP